MHLSDTQIDHFKQQRYLQFPEAFSREEIGVLNGEIPGIFSQKRPENVREKNGRTVRTTFAADTFNDAFARLGRHPG